MKILYGVQGTGNGHITRARVMARAMAESSLQVDFIFSGRAGDRYFNMDVFGNYRCFRGLTFVTERGQIRYGKTIRQGLKAAPRFFQDLSLLDVEKYDLVLCDFEPLTAWAARLAGKPCLGIAHQYAFQYPIPKTGDNLGNRLVMKLFSPVSESVGFHWHHFNQPILPPLIEPRYCEPREGEGFFLVYLPFDEQKAVLDWLNAQARTRFVMYCDIERATSQGNVRMKPFSRDGFQNDLAACEGVISNAGFGLGSECIQYGKKLLAKPLKGQMEQLSNGLALEQLGMGCVIHDFDTYALKEWMQMPNPAPVTYPDVAARLVKWLESGRPEPVQKLADELWAQVQADSPFSLAKSA